MAKKRASGRIRRRFSRWRGRRGGRRGITIPVGRAMGVGATTLGLVGAALTGPSGSVMGNVQAGKFDTALTCAAGNMRAATQPSVLLPMIIPAVVTGLTGMVLDAVKANPKLRVGRFTVKAV